ncbi:MAG: hypothetical protein JOY68_04905 [Candidatus Dormibacteraeota bacterium]|nr:hypothetical protein [Candidatus Dormibacteraeota bacterium]MBV8446127.1 hypothetical protein [Candidatus Dormibacteraeota bacterium]
MQYGLTPLSAYRKTPRRLVLLPLLLTLPAVLWLVSMPLVWHHHDIPGEGYTVLHGYQVDSWLIVAALVSLGFALRFHRWGFGFAGKWLLAIFAVIVAIGLWADYIDNQIYAASVYAGSFYGPGFIVGALGAAVLVAALPVSWRTED